jgi:large subunit ribosomal protein L11
MVQENLLASDLKAAVKQIIGTANSMPMTIDGKKAKDVIKEINEGKYDSQIQ